MSDVKRKELHPIWFFLILIVLTIVLSFVLSLLNVQGTEYSISQSGKVTTTVITVNSMVGRQGIKFVFGESINNLLKFIPFGTVIIGLIGMGTLIKTNLLKEVCAFIHKYVPRTVMFFVFSLLCIVMGFSQELAFVIMLPISVVLFTEYKRSQIIGMTLTFISISAGAFINLFITSIDYSLIEIAKNTVKSIDKDYLYGYSGNLYFVVIASLLLAVVLCVVTEFISRNKPVRISEEELEIEPKLKKKGLRQASIALLIMGVLFIYSIIPNLPLSGGLLDNSQILYVNKLFGVNSPFVNGILFIISFAGFICGLVYGISTKQIKNNKDLVKLLASNVNNIGELLLIVFAAAEFIAIFKWSNIGEVLTTQLFGLIRAGNFSFIILIALSFIAIFISGLFVSSLSTKWQLFVPSVLPLFMKSNITPEFAGALFRLSSGLSNIISPVFPYFSLYLGFMALYSRNDFSINKCYRVLFPYIISVAVLFIFIIIGWYVLGAPIGRDVLPTI